MLGVWMRNDIVGCCGAIWGVVGVVGFLAYAVIGLMPLTIDALRYSLQWYHWVTLFGQIGFMAYAEGYRGFQKRFSPRVVARARHLAQHPQIYHALLAPLFCMGVVYADWRLRLRILLLTSFIVLAIVLLSQLDQPWRGIIDAGVVVGLLWGVISLCVFSIQALTTDQFGYDPELPKARHQHTVPESFNEPGTSASRRDKESKDI
jgi:hypothetical protein